MLFSDKQIGLKFCNEGKEICKWNKIIIKPIAITLIDVEQNIMDNNYDVMGTCLY